MAKRPSPEMRTFGAARLPTHLLHVDCLRGYAILMVIACHTTALFHDLPWRFEQLLDSGWHGVQLFFLASTLTLLMSFDRERRRAGSVQWGGFFLRRFFRIAPAYYLAAIVYVSMEPARWKGLVGALGFFGFLNTWMPFKIGQDFVPGGWTISVEFSFYLLFPLLALCFHSVQRSIFLLLLAIAIAWVGNAYAVAALADRLDPQQIADYVYFSFWNQLPIFALGNVLYHLAYRRIVEAERSPEKSASRLGMWPALVLLGSLLALAVSAYLPLPRSFALQPPFLPGFFVAALCMCGAILVMASDRPSWLVNRTVAHIGKVSFSAYLWHWLVLKLFPTVPYSSWFVQQSRFAAMFAYLAVFGMVVLITWCAARITYQWIELPGMSIGRVLARRIQAPQRRMN